MTGAFVSAHLPVLQVVVPLSAATICALVTRARIAWAITVLACWASLGVSIGLVSQVLEVGEIGYHLGGWAPPWGIAYHIDPINAFVLLIVSAIGSVVAPFASASVEREIPDERRIPYFYSAFLLCLAGLLGITATGDAFNVFVFLEISSLSSYALIAMGSDRRALTAAFQYLIMGTIGATFILIGIGLLYMMTGTLNMADLAQRLPAVGGNRTVGVAFGFLMVGISLKLALFPLHLWLPNAYTFAPSAVTAFLAATATKVAVYLLLRFFFTVFGTTISFETLRLDYLLLPLALIGIFSASIVAIFQDNVKRLLAYSSVAQIGYMILGISFASVTGLTAGILHLFNHALMKGALFLALGCVAYRVGTVRLEAMRGLGRRMPWTMAAFVLGGFSVIGIPLTGGFISKGYLIMGALERGWWPVAGLVLVSSLIAVVYIWRVVEVAYLRPPNDSAGVIAEAPMSLLLPTWILVLANLYFGIDASFTTTVAGAAASRLLGVTP